LLGDVALLRVLYDPLGVATNVEDDEDARLLAVDAALQADQEDAFIEAEPGRVNQQVAFGR
jgi:hypothetical protein